MTDSVRPRRSPIPIERGGVPRRESDLSHHVRVRRFLAGAGGYRKGKDLPESTRRTSLPARYDMSSVGIRHAASGGDCTDRAARRNGRPFRPGIPAAVTHQPVPASSAHRLSGQGSATCRWFIVVQPNRSWADPVTLGFELLSEVQEVLRGDVEFIVFISSSASLQSSDFERRCGRLCFTGGRRLRLCRRVATGGLCSLAVSAVEVWVRDAPIDQGLDSGRCQPGECSEMRAQPA